MRLLSLSLSLPTSLPAVLRLHFVVHPSCSHHPPTSAFFSICRSYHLVEFLFTIFTSRFPNFPFHPLFFSQWLSLEPVMKYLNPLNVSKINKGRWWRAVSWCDINTICLFADDAMVILQHRHWTNPFSSNTGEKVKDIAEMNFNLQQASSVMQNGMAYST